MVAVSSFRTTFDERWSQSTFHIKLYEIFELSCKMKCQKTTLILEKNAVYILINILRWYR